MLFCSCFTSTNILSFFFFLSIAATNTDRKTNLGFRDKPQRENQIVFAGNKHIGTCRTWCGYPSTMVPLFPSAKNRNSECQPATTTTPVNAKTLPRESDWVCELSVSLWLHLSAPSPGLHLGILTLQIRAVVPDSSLDSRRFYIVSDLSWTRWYLDSDLVIGLAKCSS